LRSIEEMMKSAWLWQMEMAKESFKTE